MGDFCIALTGTNGCIFVTKKHHQLTEESDDFESDELLLEVIKSNLQIHNEVRKCEAKSPADSQNTIIIAYGDSIERKLIFGAIKDERRSYLLSFYNPMPISFLSSRISDFMRRFSSTEPEIIFASWTGQNKCELYTARANGDDYKCFGCVIGHQKEYIKEALLKIELKDLNVRQLLPKVVKIALEFCDEEDDDLLLSWICDETNGKHQFCDKKLVDDVMKSIRN